MNYLFNLETETNKLDDHYSLSLLRDILLLTELLASAVLPEWKIIHERAQFLVGLRYRINHYRKTWSPWVNTRRSFIILKNRLNQINILRCTPNDIAIRNPRVSEEASWAQSLWVALRLTSVLNNRKTKRMKCSVSTWTIFFVAQFLKGIFRFASRLLLRSPFICEGIVHQLSINSKIVLCSDRNFRFLPFMGASGGELAVGLVKRQPNEKAMALILSSSDFPSNSFATLGSISFDENR